MNCCTAIDDQRLPLYQIGQGTREKEDRIGNISRFEHPRAGHGFQLSTGEHLFCTGQTLSGIGGDQSCFHNIHIHASIPEFQGPVASQ